jgi:hypothetical protein
MCKECGKCSKEHSRSLDEAVDEVLDSPGYIIHSQLLI